MVSGARRHEGEGPKMVVRGVVRVKGWCGLWWMSRGLRARSAGRVSWWVFGWGRGDLLVRPF